MYSLLHVFPLCTKLQKYFLRHAGPSTVKIGTCVREDFTHSVNPEFNTKPVEGSNAPVLRVV